MLFQIYPFRPSSVHAFFIRNSILGVNGRVSQQIYIFKVKVPQEFHSNFKRHIKQLYVKLTIFLLLPVSALNIIYTIKLCQKTVVEKFSFSELKIEEVKIFTLGLTKFNVGGCLASCSTFRPFLTFEPQQLGCLYKKKKVYNYPCFKLSSISFIHLGMRYDTLSYFECFFGMFRK